MRKNEPKIKSMKQSPNGSMAKGQINILGNDKKLEFVLS